MSHAGDHTDHQNVVDLLGLHVERPLVLELAAGWPAVAADHLRPAFRPLTKKLQPRDAVFPPNTGLGAVGSIEPRTAARSASLSSLAARSDASSVRFRSSSAVQVAVPTDRARGDLVVCCVFDRAPMAWQRLASPNGTGLGECGWHRRFPRGFFETARGCRATNMFKTGNRNGSSTIKLVVSFLSQQPSYTFPRLMSKCSL